MQHDILQQTLALSIKWITNELRYIVCIPTANHNKQFPTLFSSTHKPTSAQYGPFQWELPHLVVFGPLDSRECEVKMSLYSVEKEVLGVEVDESVQERLRTVAAQLCGFPQMFLCYPAYHHVCNNKHCKQWVTTRNMTNRASVRSQKGRSKILTITNMKIIKSLYCRSSSLQLKIL